MKARTGIQCRAIDRSRDRVGESPIWDVRQGALYWVDAANSLLQRYIPDQDRYDRWKTPLPVAAVAPNVEGGVILILRDGFYAFDFDNGRFTPLQRPEEGNRRVRFNDGKIDRQGRFIAGTAVEAGVEEPLGVLYRLNSDLSFDVLETEIVIANGPCFSPDGGTFYFADSARYQIFAYDYDCSSGALSNKRVFVDTRPYGSIPDGATVDSEGYVWVALVEKGRLTRFDAHGQFDAFVELPVRYPTSVAFGGVNLDTLYVTSISRSLSGRFIATDPDAGAVFSVDRLGVRGIAEQPFIPSRKIPTI
jgi:L-arabinonolactonase